MGEVSKICISETDLASFCVILLGLLSSSSILMKLSGLKGLHNAADAEVSSSRMQKCMGPNILIRNAWHQLTVGKMDSSTPTSTTPSIGSHATWKCFLDLGCFWPISTGWHAPLLQSHHKRFNSQHQSSQALFCGCIDKWCSRCEHCVGWVEKDEVQLGDPLHQQLLCCVSLNPEAEVRS